MSILALIDGKNPEELGTLVKSSLDDFVREKIEETVNTLLLGEIEDFLTDALREQTFDIRNGYYKRHLKTKYGSISVNVPRDRLNLFETKIIQPYKQTVNDLEYIVQSLYLRGLSQNEIVKYLDESMGIDLSRESIGKMVRKIIASALEFKKRKLPKCVAIFLDGTHVPLKRKYARCGESVSDECIEVVMGITEKGVKEILDFVTVSNEGSNTWKEVLYSLKERGIGDPKIFITDGLMGMPEAIKEAFPHAKHQRCLVHIQRNISQHVRVKDRTEICDDFKKVYDQETPGKTRQEFENFIKKWEITYPHLIRIIASTPGLFTYLESSICMWKSIRTTNYIESFNAKLQRSTEHRILFNSETNEIIVLTACIADYNSEARKKKEKYIAELSEEERYQLGFEIVA